VSILIAPGRGRALSLFDRDYYSGLAVTLRRGEEVDVEMLTAHLAGVGYTQMDLVEMPGQFTRRGGILDVYSPESDRPVRIEFFGDEIETIRKFDPETQRSQSPLDETSLLPLTETPVTERLLAAVHARLNRSVSKATPRTTKTKRWPPKCSAGGVSVFPGWEFFSAVAGAHKSLLTLMPKCVLFIEEPAMVRNQIERWWNKVEQRHERSGIGSLITPEDIYLGPKFCRPSSNRTWASISINSASSTCSTKTPPSARLSSTRAHAALPRLHSRADEQLKKLMEPSRASCSPPQPGRRRALATMLREYQIPYRLGSRARTRRNMLDEASYLAGDLRVPVIVRARSPPASASPTRTWSSSAPTTSPTSRCHRAPRAQAKSKTAAFVSDFRDLTIGDYVVHVEHGIAQYQGLKEIVQDGLSVEFMILEFAEQAKLYVPLTGST
jgi:transcription-repair coupling factor (superfamily II helicase)